jgi:hypothetical protein
VTEGTRFLFFLHLNDGNLHSLHDAIRLFLLNTDESERDGGADGLSVPVASSSFHLASTWRRRRGRLFNPDGQPGWCARSFRLDCNTQDFALPTRGGSDV